MNEIERKFNKVLAPLICGENTICLGVSGGSDSMAMLLLAKSYADIYGVQIFVVTVDHMLRSESRDEVLYVQDICQKLNIKHVIRMWYHEDIPHSQIEAEARKARHRFMIEECVKRGAKSILLAHNLNEQLETYFIRKNMNSGDSGLACMSLKRTLNEDISIARPCLQFTKRELQEYLTNQGIRWMEDPMNYDENFIRVRYRNMISRMHDNELNDLLDTIIQYGQERSDQEMRAVSFLRTHDIINENGFADIRIYDFSHLERSTQHCVLKKVIRCISHEEYSISDQVCDNIIGNKHYTCSKIVVKKTKDRIIIYRENRNLSPCLFLNKGDKVVWDNRFVIESHIDSLHVKAYGKAHSINDLPSYICATMPALFVGDELVHIGCTTNDDLGFSCVFKRTSDFFDIFYPLRSDDE